MLGKQKRVRRPSTSGKTTPSIAEGEIDVLRVLVKSTLAKDQGHEEKLTEASFGAIRVDFARHELFRKGKQLKANAREFRLLRYFLQHEGEVVSRHQLLTDVWGFEEVPSTRSVDNYILSLRKKIEVDATHPKHILTFRGAGYKFLR
jgi:two-component system alkaline phosphatase synthesis response regulator PhoP